MKKIFRERLKENNDKILSMNIRTEKVFDSTDVSDPGMTIMHESERCLGQVSVWESGMMAIEVIEDDGDKPCLQVYLELGDSPDFSAILVDYFKAMLPNHP